MVFGEKTEKLNKMYAFPCFIFPIFEIAFINQIFVYSFDQSFYISTLNQPTVTRSTFD